MEMRPANTAEEQYSTRACGLAQLAEGRQRKISGHERRARFGLGLKGIDFLLLDRRERPPFGVGSYGGTGDGLSAGGGSG